METRMERYAKYRESIKRMAPEEFEPRKIDSSAEAAVKDATLPDLSFSYDAALQEEGSHNRTGPYSLYLKRRKRWLLIKAICLLVVATIFIVWWFLLQGRK